MIILFSACNGEENHTNDNTLALQPKGLKSIYRHSILAPVNWNPIDGFIGIGPTYKETSIALFVDGTYSSNINDMIEKSHKPKSKGRWRFKGNMLQLARAKDSIFEDTLRSYAIDSGGVDQKLNGCFMENRGSQNTYAGIRKDFCFDTSGNFIYRGKVPLYDATVHKGHYRIDGYVIEFTHTNGDKFKKLFAFLLDNKKDIEIGDMRYSQVKGKISDIKEKESNKLGGKKLVIVKRAPNQKDICEYARDVYIKGGFKNISVEEKLHDVTCHDYGLRENGKECRVIFHKGKHKGNTICLVWHSGR